ncbi:MAG: hypothetical protein AABW91_02345 [Nanoarchaeota archaeon]
MKQKKGDWTVEEIAKIIVSIVLLFLLGYLAFSLYQAIIQKSELEQAKIHIENIEGIIKGLEEEGGGSKEYILLSPSGWALYGFPYGENNVKACQIGNKPCLCLCPETKFNTGEYGSMLSGLRIPPKEEVYKDFSKSCKETSACKSINVEGINVAGYDPYHIAILGYDGAGTDTEQEKTFLPVDMLMQSRKHLSVNLENNNLVIKMKIDKNEQKS